MLGEFLERKESSFTDRFIGMLEERSDLMDGYGFFFIDLWESLEDGFLFIKGAFGVMESTQQGGERGQGARADLGEALESA
jgi:hypothetical protein